MSSNGWVAGGCDAHVCSPLPQRITANRTWQLARLEEREKTYHSREETRPAEFPPASRRPHPPEVEGFYSHRHLVHHFFFLVGRGINYVSLLTHRWQRNRGRKLLRYQNTAALLNRICCDWTWIRRNRRLHGWLRSGCWNRRRRPSRILKHFCRPPWKMGWSCVDCWGIGRFFIAFTTVE